MIDHSEDIEILAEQLEGCRIASGAIFEKFANDGNYKTAAIFQMLRDSLAAYQELLENLTVVTKEDE